MKLLASNNDFLGGIIVAIDGMARMGREEFRAARPRIYGTNPADPEHGRVFVWSKVGWFERVGGPWGDVAFTPAADSEDELKDWLSQTIPDLDFVEVDLNTDFGKTAFAEFKEQSEYALYPEAPENSSEEPFEEQDKT
jgi:hypothetical protein